ncbi:hypothetical protein Zmor_028039 [Zophobas morio]|uniref:Uncharacterized protein n=1 Tax=Zophobas morio TaxID=2755281 RepID=A0AA38HPA4_9CUCU|nr:hypothetical protein Zmor_028039 [Zophobas morio]
MRFSWRNEYDNKWQRWLSNINGPRDARDQWDGERDAWAAGGTVLVLLPCVPLKSGLHARWEGRKRCVLPGAGADSGRVCSGCGLNFGMKGRNSSLIYIFIKPVKTGKTGTTGFKN